MPAERHPQAARSQIDETEPDTIEPVDDQREGATRLRPSEVRKGEQEGTPQHADGERRAARELLEQRPAEDELFATSEQGLREEGREPKSQGGGGQRLVANPRHPAN